MMLVCRIESLNIPQARFRAAERCCRDDVYQQSNSVRLKSLKASDDKKVCKSRNRDCSIKGQFGAVLLHIAYFRGLFLAVRAVGRPHTWPSPTPGRQVSASNAPATNGTNRLFDLIRVRMFNVVLTCVSLCGVRVTLQHYF